MKVFYFTRKVYFHCPPSSNVAECGKRSFVRTILENSNYLEILQGKTTKKMDMITTFLFHSFIHTCIHPSMPRPSSFGRNHDDDDYSEEFKKDIKCSCYLEEKRAKQKKH